jgi:hypothetical protein
MKKSLNHFFIIISVILILISLGILFYYLSRDDTVSYYNSSSNKFYKIRNIGSDDSKINATKYLENLRSKIDTLVLYMKNNNLPDVAVANRLYYRWFSCNLRETSSADTAVASTVDKGREIKICIRNGPNSFEDINTALFVMLHELAHIMSISKDHTIEFFNNFSYITHLASYLGIYKPENFAEKPKTYCGFQIKTTPCSNGTCSLK